MLVNVIGTSRTRFLFPYSFVFFLLNGIDINTKKNEDERNNV